MTTSPAEQRRQKLLSWLRERHEWERLTATEIVEASGIYTGHARYDRCFDDLKVLQSREAVQRAALRPARWWVPVSYIVEGR